MIRHVYVHNWDLSHTHTWFRNDEIIRTFDHQHDGGSLDHDHDDKEGDKD